MTNMETIPRGIIWDASKGVVREYICFTRSLKEIRDQNRFMLRKKIKE